MFLWFVIKMGNKRLEFKKQFMKSSHNFKKFSQPGLGPLGAGHKTNG